MIMSLLNAAADLEKFAREAEKNCALLIYMLSFAFQAYEMKEPVFPKLVPLSAYPLDYRPPEGKHYFLKFYIFKWNY